MKVEYHGIQIDLDKDKLFNEFSMSLFRQFYMLKEEKSPQESLARAALAYCYGDLEFAQRIYDYASNQWFMYSSPVISNAPKPGEKTKALPASCYLEYVGDDLHSLINHSSETRWLSVRGGGVGGHWSSVRAVSDKAPGPIPFLKCIDADMQAYTQGVTRRASYAAYLDVSHPDILEFLEMRIPTGGDANRKCFNLHHAVNITDDFMQAALEDKEWHLLDPHTKEIRDTVGARELLHKIIDIRFKTGEPYIEFIDTANRFLPDFQKRLGLEIHGSNLCIEIQQATNEERTAVCILSSLNAEFFEEWQHTNIVQDLIRLLDNVTQTFIDNATEEISKAKYAAMRERSLGLGTLGWHSYLQRYMVPWESAMAKAMNVNMYSLIKERAFEETRRLAKEKGACPDDDTGTVRNSHLLAIAPNANSAILANSSASVEPIKSNAYAHKMRAGTFLVKNKHLERLLLTKVSEDKIKDIWDSIVLEQGSVQHLDCLSEDEKAVFKTAFEIDQKWVIQHAADRQPFICQGQSINLFFPYGSERNYVLSVHLKAWKDGLKSLYYLRSSAGSDVNISKKIERIPLVDYVNQEECLACHA